MITGKIRIALTSSDVIVVLNTTQLFVVEVSLPELKPEQLYPDSIMLRFDDKALYYSGIYLPVGGKLSIRGEGVNGLYTRDEDNGLIAEEEGISLTIKWLLFIRTGALLFQYVFLF